jgi:multiple antibiotic resistance protein
MDWSLISNFFIAMIAIVNPLGKVPLWLQASTGEEGSVRWRLAILVTLTAFVILLVSLLAGKPFLELFGVDLASFRVGGGVVILLLAIKMIGDTAVDIEADEDEEAEGSKFRQAQSRFKRVVVPMAMPILAGPGSISTAIVYSVRAEGLTDYLMMSGVLLVVMVVMLLTLLVSPQVQRLLGATVLDIQTRLFGLILTGIAFWPAP